MSTYGTDDFWQQYEEFVAQNAYRHRKIIDGLLDSWSTRWNLRNMRQYLDLGCGRAKEATQLFGPPFVDVDNDPKAMPTLVLDYRKDFQRIEALKKKFYFFTSLFSTECTASQVDNVLFYEQLFKTFRSLKFGIVSGFYYRSKEDQVIVKETGGLESFQSIGRLANSEIYAEYRLESEAPSKLFGPDVIEVWKLLVKR